MIVTIRRRNLFIPGLLILISAIAFSEGTRTWEQTKFEELIKGTAKGVAVLSNGGLELAPAFKPLSTTPSTYIWAIASDDAGNLFAAAGSPARIYRITPDGASTAIFQPQELQVQKAQPEPLVLLEQGDLTELFQIANQYHQMGIVMD